MERYAVHSIEMTGDFTPHIDENIEDFIDETNFLGNIQIPTGLVNPIPTFRDELRILLGHDPCRHSFEFEGPHILLIDHDGIPILQLRRLP